MAVCMQNWYRTALSSTVRPTVMVGARELLGVQSVLDTLWVIWSLVWIMASIRTILLTCDSMWSVSKSITTIVDGKALEFRTMASTVLW